MYGAIVVGTDGSETAKEAVRQATEFAKALVFVEPAQRRRNR